MPRVATRKAPRNRRPASKATRETSLQQSAAPIAYQTARPVVDWVEYSRNPLRRTVLGPVGDSREWALLGQAERPDLALHADDVPPSAQRGARYAEVMAVPPCDCWRCYWGQAVRDDWRIGLTVAVLVLLAFFLDGRVQAAFAAGRMG
jgi:hypothetical protein